MVVEGRNYLVAPEVTAGVISSSILMGIAECLLPHQNLELLFVRRSNCLWGFVLISFVSSESFSSLPISPTIGDLMHEIIGTATFFAAIAGILWISKGLVTKVEKESLTSEKNSHAR